MSEINDRNPILSRGRKFIEKREFEEGNEVLWILKDGKEAKFYFEEAPKMRWVETKQGAVKLNCKDVLYAEKEKNGLTVITKNRKIEGIKVGLEEFIKIIDDNKFCRCHKSFALNKEYIIALKNIDRRLWEAVFDFSETIKCPVGNSYYEDVVAE